MQFYLRQALDGPLTGVSWKLFVRAQVRRRAPGRRQMPQFHLSDKELDDLAAFFEWVSKINTQNWPPNKAG